MHRLQVAPRNISQRDQRSPQNSFSQSPFDCFQMLSSILVTIAKGEQIVQCIREVLVQDPTFTPMNLFRYISKSERYIRSFNITAILDQNNLLGEQKQTLFYLNKVFKRYGINKDNIQYTNFISFLFPWNSGVLRDVTVNRVKNYPSLDRLQKNLRPSDSVLTAFISLIDQEIIVEKKIQAQISDPRFPDTSKLKKVIKSIKKASHKLCTSVIQKSNDHISMLQLRNFIKAFLQVPEHLFIYLGRRLSMNKSGLVSLQIIENTLKKTKKSLKISDRSFLDKKIEVGNEMDEESFENIQYEKEQNYRDQLYKQLADTLKLSHESRKTPRNKSKPAKKNNPYQEKQQQMSKNRAKTPNRGIAKKQNRFYLEEPLDHQEYYETPIQNLGYSNKIERTGEKDNHRKTILKENNAREEQESKKRVNQMQNNYNKIFKEYIQIFLKGSREIDKSKKRLASNRIDFMTLFKSIDRGTGAINASDIRNLYVKLSGIPTDYDFELIVQRFSQHGEQWLSYSQFTEIFKAENGVGQPDNMFEESNRVGLTYSVDLSPQNMRVLSQILYLTLDLEYCLKAVVQRLSPSDIDRLFHQICSNSSLSEKSFINYQQLKKYITEELELQTNMADTMALLKRLDRSKNGVVIKQEFLSH